MQDAERRRAIETALSRLEETHARAGSIPSGCLSLDWALGAQGYPRGRIVEIFGPSASGKTTLALAAVAESQRAGGTAGYIDAEHALDTAWARTVGVDLSALLVSQPGSGEEALEIAGLLAASGTVDVVVLDSVAALVPRAELGGGMGEAPVGFQERMISGALRKLASAALRSGACLLFLNQLRGRAERETTAGGMAIRAHAAVRVEVQPAGDCAGGSRAKVRIVKNKVAPPFREAVFDILYAEGLDRAGDLLTLALAQGLIVRNGAAYAFGGVPIGDAREPARRWLRDHSDARNALETGLRTRLGMPHSGPR